MILKKEKVDKTLKRYKTLSSTSCLGKIRESIVIEQLVNNFEKLNLWGDQRSAYRSGRSTTGSVPTLTEEATTGFNRKGATVAAVLNVEQSFDSARHEGILYKQFQINTPWWII